MTFRFDDVCGTSDFRLLNSLTDFLIEKVPQGKIIWAVSPLVHSSQVKTQRVFPQEWNALSDYKIHYNLDSHPSIGYSRLGITVATHGLIHADHRLLSRGAQELSILLSASLVGSRVFVPPFNKWNKDTEDICSENGITLIKFEDGWKSMEYNKFNEQTKFWYLHAREWTLDSFKKWFD